MYEVKICEAASLLNMDYELIEYITKADKYMSDQEITEKVNDIQNIKSILKSIVIMKHPI